jgi:hypothetical protein
MDGAQAKLAMGRVAEVARMQAAYNDCLVNTKNYLNRLNQGGSQGSTGNTGNTGNTQIMPVQPSCSGPPGAPTLSFVHTKTGVSVTIAAPSGSPVAERFGYWTTFYSSKEFAWSKWSEITYLTSTTVVEFSRTTDDHKRIALQAQAVNVCGTSPIVNLDNSSTGVIFYDPPKDEVQKVLSEIKVGESFAVDRVFNTSSGGEIELEITTPKICQVKNGVISGKAAGECLVFTTSPGDASLSPTQQSFRLLVVSTKKTISCFKKGNSKIVRKVTAVNPKCPTGFSTKR